MFDKYYFKRLCIIPISIFFILTSVTHSIADTIPQPVKGDDGIFRHSWMTKTFLDLKEDFLRFYYWKR